MTENSYWLPGLSQSVVALSYSADGTRLFAAARDGTVLAWAGAGGSPPELWARLPEAPTAIRVERHGATLLAATAERAFVATLPRDFVPKLYELSIDGGGRTPSIVAADFLADGSVLVASAQNGGPSELLLFEGDSYAQRTRKACIERPLLACAVARHARRTLLRFADGRVAAAQLEQDFWLDVTRRPLATNETCAWNPEGSEVAVVRGTNVERYTPPDLDPIDQVAAHAPVRQVFYGTAQHLVLVLRSEVVVHPIGWDGAVQLVSHRAPIKEAVMRPDGELVALLGLEDGVSVFHGSASSRALRIYERGRHATAVAVEPRGLAVAIGHDDGAVKLVLLPEAWHTHLPAAEAKSHPHSLFATCLFWTSTGEPTIPWIARHSDEWWMIRINDFPAQSMYSALSSAGACYDFDSWPRNWWRPE